MENLRSKVGGRVVLAGAAVAIVGVSVPYLATASAAATSHHSATVTHRAAAATADHRTAARHAAPPVAHAPATATATATKVHRASSRVAVTKATKATTAAPAAVTAKQSTTVLATTKQRSVVATTTSDTAAAAHVPMKDFGIQPATLDKSQWDALLGIAQRAGAKVISADVSWSSYEPSGPAPAGEWTNLDSFVNDVRSRGMLVRFQLVQMPQWARSPGQPSFSAASWLGPSTNPELNLWAGWVERVVGHFGSRVSYYEIWNEENISNFWSQGPSPTEFAALMYKSYFAAMAVDPKANIMSGGLSCNDIGFLEALYKIEDKNFPNTAVRYHHFFDILGVHPYSGNRSPAAVLPAWVFPDQWGLMDDNFLGLEQMHAVMAANGEGYKHEYIGEYGFSTTVWNNYAPVPDSTRATYLTQAFDLAGKTGYVDGLCWYYFYVTPWNPASWALLLGNNYQPTLTFRALEAVA